ncbi:MAG: hypothetical protein RLZZ500_1598 [Bacteroidota bacterium]|jgi:glycosyltransferase involved in cell wall biosynthesis
MTKKRILFIMNNLHCGGAEKALVSLLQSLDYSQFDVDLMLFRKEGLFLKQVPEEVTLLPSPKAYGYFDSSFLKSIGNAFFRLRWDIIWNRILFSYHYKKEQHPGIREQKVWRYISACLPRLKGNYDLAIGFLENSPNYYCIEKVNASCKVGMIHSDYEALGLDPQLDEKYFKAFHYVATISEHCVTVLKQNFINLSDKFFLLKNITAVQLIQKLAKEPISFTKSELDLVTIGRLVPLKGFDFVLDAAKRLKETGLNFKWYIIGDGPLREELHQQISDNNLSDTVIMTGLLENPYPYLELCDYYVHTSRYEGKSVAIDEAKIMNKPIIVTNFSTVNDQITHAKTGWIVTMDGQSIAEAILHFKQNNAIPNQLSQNLKDEEVDTSSEIEKISQLAKKGQWDLGLFE